MPLKILDENYDKIRVMTEEGQEIAVIENDDLIVIVGYKIMLKPSEKEDEEEFPGKTVADETLCPYCKSNAWFIIADKKDEEGKPISNEDENGNIVCRCGDCYNEFKVSIDEKISLAA